MHLVETLGYLYLGASFAIIMAPNYEFGKWGFLLWMLFWPFFTVIIWMFALLLAFAVVYSYCEDLCTKLK